MLEPHSIQIGNGFPAMDVIMNRAIGEICLKAKFLRLLQQLMESLSAMCSEITSLKSTAC